MTTNNPAPSLEELGWDSFFKEHFQTMKVPASIPARIISEQRHFYRASSQYGELTVEISGKLRYQAQTGDQYPAVGDWVVVRHLTEEQRGVIHAILPRKSKFSRRVSGGRQRLSGSRTEEQVVATNIDTVFIVNGLDGGRNLNLRRTERYLTLAWNSGARPVIILNKIDICPDVEACIRDVESVAVSVPIHAISATERLGLEVLWTYLDSGSTAALLGLSGVGKSAIINALLNTERQSVRAVRNSDLRGRHTTSHREIINLSTGGNIIDTPGMREIQVWSDQDSLNDAFDDIEQVARQCRFADCTHQTEPGCAVREAIEAGKLDIARLQSYSKLQRELNHLVARQENKTHLEEKAKWKKISQWSKQIRRNKEGG